MASGSEIQLILKAAQELEAAGHAVRVVSMPSCELFDRQSEEYRNQVLPLDIRARVAVEAASSFGWQRYVGLDGEVVGLDRFGASAPYETIMKELGFTVEHITALAESLLKKLG